MFNLHSFGENQKPYEMAVFPCRNECRPADIHRRGFPDIWIEGLLLLKFFENLMVRFRTYSRISVTISHLGSFLEIRTFI